MQQEKANYSIKRMSRLLEVSRSGYYKWQKAQAVRLRGENQRQRFLDQLDRKIHDIWEDSDEVYGAPRITAELAEGVCSRNDDSIQAEVNASRPSETPI